MSCLRSQHNVPGQESSALTMVIDGATVLHEKMLSSVIFRKIRYVLTSVFVLKRPWFLSFSYVSGDAMFSWDT